MIRSIKDIYSTFVTAFSGQTENQVTDKEDKNSRLLKILRLYKQVFFPSDIKDISATRELPGAGGITITQGIYKNSLFNLARVDLDQNRIGLWVAQKDLAEKFKVKKLDDIAKLHSPHIALNGTFYNVENDNQPLGILISNYGKKSWDPTTKTFDGIPVVNLNRYYFGIDKDGKPRIGKTEGKPVKPFVEEGFKMLIGGGGPLILNGNIIVSKESLKEARFHYSTHQIDKPRQRTAIGIDSKGSVMMVTFGHQYLADSGITLTDLAEFMIKGGARDAIFLDSGSSTGMYISDDGCDQTGVPKAQPTFLVVKDKEKKKKR